MIRFQNMFSLVNLVVLVSISNVCDGRATDGPIVIQSCIAVAQLSYDYISCVKTARKAWKIDQIQVDDDDEAEQMAKDKYLYCCGTWDLNDCLVDASEKVCTESEGREVDAMMTDINSGLENNNCSKYPYRSWSCHFPFWLTSLIVFASVVVLTIIAYICVNCCSND